jgi:hypothetical protein
MGLAGKNLRPALVLALIAPVLTELLSGNIPAPVFFLPWIYAFLLVVYGLPVLLARELYVAWRLRLSGLFFLGLAYGIFNEGVCAKTLLLDVNVPIDAFDHRTWLGINFPWAFLIVPWHALHAIVFPIALVTWWFPAQAPGPWLSRRAFLFISLFLALFGTVVYLVNKTHVTPPIYLLFFAGMMAFFVLAAKRTEGSGGFLEADGPRGFAPAAVGFTFYPVFVLGLCVAANLGLPRIVLCLLATLLLLFYGFIIARRGWRTLTPFVLFALGDYFSGALLTGLVLLAKGSVVGVITELVLMAGFLVLTCAVRRESCRSRTIMGI